MNELKRWVYLIVGILVILTVAIFVCLRIAERRPDQANQPWTQPSPLNREVTVQK